MKKRLAGNQVIIAYMRKSKNFDSLKVKPAITAKMNGKTFKAHGEVKIAKARKSVSLVFEAVRREDDWETKFVERMRLYKDFLENFVPFDSTYEARPQLILVCEDDKHMIETFKEIVKNNLEVNNTKIYFTTDLKQNSESLDKSLTEFAKNEETGKFAAKNVEFKILE